MEQITVTLTLTLTLARYAMEQTLLREMREDVASLGAEGCLTLSLTLTLTPTLTLTLP